MVYGAYSTYTHVYVSKYIHIIIDGLREMDNTYVNVSSSQDDTTQNVTTLAMTSNTESEVSSKFNDQGIATNHIGMCIKIHGSESRSQRK